MPDPVDVRLRRYLRVAYEGGADEPDHGLARRPGRWAVAAPSAVRIAAVLLVLAVAAATVLVLTRLPQTPASSPSDAPAMTPPAPSPAVTAPVAPVDGAVPDGTASGPAVLVVHVAGAVATPGVVELGPGTRVAEAIAAAGGPTDDADLDALNLAAPVGDGQQVYVPAVGEVVPPASGAAASGGGVPGDSSVGGASAGTTGQALVDINTADAAALEALPGIGPALAARVVEHRTAHGPFPSVEALTDVAGIGPATMDRLRDLVTV